MVLAQRHAALQHLCRFRDHVKGNLVAVHNDLRADLSRVARAKRKGRPAGHPLKRRISLNPLKGKRKAHRNYRVKFIIGDVIFNLRGFDFEIRG